MKRILKIKMLIILNSWFSLLDICVGIDSCYEVPEWMLGGKVKQVPLDMLKGTGTYVVSTKEDSKLKL